MFEIIHLGFILYTIFLLPFYIGFRAQIFGLWIFLEIMATLEYLFFLFLEFRTPFYTAGVLTVERKKIYKHNYNSKKFWIDLITSVPLNIFIWGIWGDSLPSGFERVFIDLLRILRVISCYKLKEIIHQIEIKFRTQQFFIEVTMNIIIFSLLWHLLACFWFWLDVFQSHEDSNWIYQAPQNFRIFKGFFGSPITEPPGRSESRNSVLLFHIFHYEYRFDYGLEVYERV